MKCWLGGGWWVLACAPLFDLLAPLADFIGMMPPLQAFMTGMSVGLMLLGGRHAGCAPTLQRTLLAVVLAGVLLLLGSLALLLAGIGQAHPTVYYQ